MRLLLVRHGLTELNARRVFMGHDPVPLAERGRAQIGALAERLRGEGIERIVASDIERARESAEILARRIGLDYETAPELREIDVGDAKGLAYDEAARRWPGILTPDGSGRFPRGESFLDVSRRATAFVRERVLPGSERHVLLVAHGGVVTGLLGGLLEKSLDQVGTCANASLTILDAEEGRITLVVANDTSHLEGETPAKPGWRLGG